MSEVIEKLRILIGGTNEERNKIKTYIIYCLIMLAICYLSNVILLRLDFTVKGILWIINFMFIVFGGYILIYAVKTTNKLNVNNAHIEKLENSNKKLIEENDKIRLLKHDFNNILQAVNGYVKTEDIPSLKVYMKKLIGDINETETIKVANKQFLSNAAIVSILNKAYDKAKKENVNINFEIMYDLSLLKEYEYELTRILGIFLDNAIEAEREEEDKNIDVLFLKMNNDKYIIIENTCKNKDIDLEKIYTKEFSTKKGNTGLGLWEVRNIVNKIEEMSLNTVIENERFKHILKVS